MQEKPTSIELKDSVKRPKIQKKAVLFSKEQALPVIFESQIENTPVKKSNSPDALFISDDKPSRPGELIKDSVERQVPEFTTVQENRDRVKVKIEKYKKRIVKKRIINRLFQKYTQTNQKAISNFVQGKGKGL